MTINNHEHEHLEINMAEIFTDVSTNAIPRIDTWNTLSYDGLIDVRNKLLNKQFIAGRNKIYLQSINSSLAILENLLQEKLNNSRGSR
jgi:hypothetical protein